MPVIKPSCLRDIKTRINIADVVGRTVTLKKAGATLKGLCPFHQEKTPSFYVHPDKGYYKCFGCGKSGDAIDFVRETEQLDFAEAVEALGQRFNVPIEYEDGAGPTQQDRSLRQELFDLHEQAADHFHGVLRSSEPAGEFLRRYWIEDRKFTPELADEFKIGAAPADGTGLAARLLKRKYSEDALRQCGLFFIRENAPIALGTLRSRFRGRLMIPIRDHQSRVVAFTARQTALTPEDDPAREAKYVNSPETPIFSKSHLLFNLDRARTGAGPGHPFVMVEGQLDALRCWSVGLTTAVAPQGTALTESQLLLLRRYHPEVECFFDSDSAGQKAALRMLPLALKAAIEVRFIGAGGDGKVDPDVLFRDRGLAAYDELRRTALSPMAFACRALGAGASSPEQKARAAESVFEIIATSDSAVVRDQFVDEAAKHLGLYGSAMKADFERYLARRGRAPAPAPAKPTPPPIRSDAPERDLLILLLHYDSFGPALNGAMPFTWIDTSHPEGFLLNQFLAEIEQGDWPGKDEAVSLTEDPAHKELLTSLLFESPNYDDPVKIASEAYRKIRDRHLGQRRKELARAIESPDSGDGVERGALLKERFEIERQLRQPVLLKF